MARPETEARDGHSLKDALTTGAAWGLVGALAMAMYAMIAAATYQGTGFFTPMYHIASVVTDPEPMMQSMQHAGRGESFFFRPGPALIGMMVHIVVGVAYSVIFFLAGHALRLAGGVSLVAGMGYGLIVMLFSAFIGLPVAASLFGGGEPISTMPTMVGWSTFTIEHILFGASLGMGYWLAHRGGIEHRAPQTA